MPIEPGGTVEYGARITEHRRRPRPVHVAVDDSVHCLLKRVRGLVEVPDQRQVATRGKHSVEFGDGSGGIEMMQRLRDAHAGEVTVPEGECLAPWRR